MSNAPSISYGMVRRLTRFGVLMAALAGSLVLYARFGAPPRTIPAARPFPVLPKMAAVHPDSDLRLFESYRTGRDLFAYRATTRPTPFPVLRPEAKPKPPAPPPPPPPPDTKGLVLTGVALNTDTGDVAVVESPAEKRSWILQVGDRLRNATVVAIGEDAIRLETDRKASGRLSMARIATPAGAAETVTQATDGPRIGIAVRVATAAELQSAGAAQGLYIERVAPGLPLRIGDILVSLEKQAIHTVPQAIAAFRSHRPRGKASVAVSREGRRLHFALPLIGE